MVEIVRRLIVAGMAIGLFAGNLDKVSEFYNDTVAETRVLATAADLRAIGTMLDYHFMKKGRYPDSGAFLAWMVSAFKENPGARFGYDHWGQPLDYRTKNHGKSFVLSSPGPDGFHGTSDDLAITGP